MTKRISIQLLCLFVGSLLISACSQQAKIAFHPFKGSIDLSYEDLVEAGFYRVSEKKDLISRFDGMRQVSFNLEPSDCVPNIMNDGVECSNFEPTDRIFNQYFEQFDSVQIVQVIDAYGGKVEGKWRKDILEGDQAGEWQKEWFFPIYAANQRFTGTVMVRETGLTALSITNSNRQIMRCGSPSLEYMIKDAAKQLVSDRWN